MSTTEIKILLTKNHIKKKKKQTKIRLILVKYS
jgi:hypothetical protein